MTNQEQQRVIGLWLRAAGWDSKILEKALISATTESSHKNRPPNFREVLTHIVRIKSIMDLA